MNKIIDYCHKVGKAEGIKVCRSYAREVKELKRTQRFRGKSHGRQKAAKADRRMHTVTFRNEYDGHTIDWAKEQVRRLYKGTVRISICRKYGRELVKSAGRVTFVADLIGSPYQWGTLPSQVGKVPH